MSQSNTQERIVNHLIDEVDRLKRWEVKAQDLQRSLDHLQNIYNQQVNITNKLREEIDEYKKKDKNG